MIIFFSAGFISFPEVVNDSSARLIRFHQKFSKPARFTFILQNTDLEVVMGKSLDLKLLCKGKEIPEIVYVNIGGNNFLMNKDGETFKYTIENINSSFPVYFTDKKYVSDEYKISVLNRPFISEFTVDIQSPTYTGLNNENLAEYW